MNSHQKKPYEDLVKENGELHAQLEETREILTAIRTGTVDALVVEGPKGEQIYALHGVDYSYRVFVEHMNEGAVTIDSDGMIVYANRVFADLVDVPLEQTLGVELQRFILPADRPHWDELIRETNGEASRRELTLLCARGESIPVLLSARHLPIEPGQFYCCIVSDLRQQRLHDQLQQSEERFRMLADNMAQLAWTCAELGNVTWYNQRWLDYTGLSFEEMKHWGWIKVHHPHHVDRVVASVTRSRESGEIWEDTFPLRGKDGQYRWFLSRAEPIRDEQGKLVRWFGTNTDITEQRQAEQELREAQERLQNWNVELEQAVNVKTAELKQSQERLRALASELNLAEQRERKRLATELHDHLQQMLVVGKIAIGQGKRVAVGMPACESAFQRVDSILSDALTYSRTLVAELCPPVLHEHGLVAGLKWLAEYIKNKQEQTVTVIVPEDHELHLAEEQRVLLFQSIRELLINASKHAGTGEATVVITERADQIQIEVRDHGRGFDPAAVTPSNGISSKFGLFSIQERMRAIGGSFEIQSSPGLGTTATLVLPLEKKPVEPEHASQSLDTDGAPLASAHSRGPRIRVLLVDDHIMVRQGLRAILDAYADIELVAEAGDGEEAVRLVGQWRPDVVVMDISLPRMNGIDATMQIKLQYPETIIIGLSVNAAGENREAMERAGAVRLMTKEAAVEQLYGAIQEAWRQRTLSQGASWNLDVTSPGMKTS